MTTRRRSLAMAALLLAATAGAAESASKRAQGRKGPPPACQQVMEEMKASDARFQEQVKRMNETQGTEKIDAMAAALNELATQRRTMHERVASTPHPGMGPGMSGCPGLAR